MIWLSILNAQSSGEKYLMRADRQTLTQTKVIIESRLSFAWRDLRKRFNKLLSGNRIQIQIPVKILLYRKPEEVDRAVNSWQCRDKMETHLQLLNLPVHPLLSGLPLSKGQLLKTFSLGSFDTCNVVLKTLNRGRCSEGFNPPNCPYATRGKYFVPWFVNMMFSHQFIALILML